MHDPRPGPVIVAIGGGKGGVGKSFLAANLALALAQRGATIGRRVAAVDLDFGGSNLNLFLGESFPERELADFLDDRAENLDAISQPTQLDNLRYIAGSFDLITAVDPLRDRKLDLVRALVGLNADYVVLDLPAGSAPATLDFFFLGDIKLVVTNPEATAFHNAYGFLKNYLLRRLLTEFRDRKEIMSFILDHYRTSGTATEVRDRTITSLVENLRTEFPAVRPEVTGILQENTPLLVLNRSRGRRDREFLTRFRSVLEENLGLVCQALGVIPENRRVAQAVRDGEPFLLVHPRHKISKQLISWTDQLTDRRSSRR